MDNDNGRRWVSTNDDDDSISTQSTVVLGADFVHRTYQNQGKIPSARERMREAKSAPDIVLCIKLIMLGDFSVGKTSIIARFLNQKYDENTKATVAMEFHERTLRVYPNVLIRFRLWDLAGQERFQSIAKTYYRDAHAVIIVDDCASSPSNHRQTVSKWHKRFCSQFPESPPTSKKEDCVSIRDQLVRHQRDRKECGLDIVPNSLKDVVFALAMSKCDVKKERKNFESQKEDFDIVKFTSAREDKEIDALFWSVGRECADRIFARMTSEGLSVTKSYTYEGGGLDNYWRVRMPRRDTKTKNQSQQQIFVANTKTKECPCTIS